MPFFHIRRLRKLRRKVVWLRLLMQSMLWILCMLKSLESMLTNCWFLNLIQVNKLLKLPIL